MRKFISWCALADEYIDYRRAFGYDLTAQGYIVRAFTKHLDEANYKGHLSIEVQTNWINSYETNTSYNKARKLHAIRLFSKYLANFDSATEVPDRKLFGKAQAGFRAHIYSESELKIFFEALKKDRDGRKEFNTTTFEIVFGLILTCGLRASEATNLLCEDIDFEKGTIHIVEGKFKKSRLIPIQKSVVVALANYKKLRDETFPRCRTNVFFVMLGNIPVRYSSVLQIFLRVKKSIGWTEHNKRRIHDLRHTFIITRLLEWHRLGIDSDKKIAALSVYVGHADVAHTYWYFHLVPELQEIVSKRFENLAKNPRRLS